MNRNFGAFTFTASVLLALAGCASSPSKSEQPQAETPMTEQQQIDSVLKKIDQSTVLAVNAQRELAMTADAKVAHEALLRKRMLTDVVDFDFFGDVEDILREIAMKYGYDFNVYGQRPPERLNVNVFVRKRPVLEVLKQIGYQGNNAIDIKVTKDAIELHYKQKAEH